MTDTMTTREWVRRTLARFLDEEADRERSVGALDLAPFQARAARRGTEIARRYGGVIVADAVGLGKTRVAIAIVESLRRDRRLQSSGRQPVWVCVPARLREQWRRKMTQAGFENVELLSHTEMSREDLAEPETEPGVLLVDEAHRFRNPSTNRHATLAGWTAEVPVVMATATPVCNSIWDLYHLFSLFVAEHDFRPVVGLDLEDAFERADAGDVDLTELIERLVIRRTTPPTRGQFGSRPSVRLEMLTYEPAEPEAWMWANLESTLRDLSFDACAPNWPRGLFVEYTLRRWESGPESLAETLERLVEYHRRWLEARRHGRTLDRAEFRELFSGPDEFRQEVFPFLFPDAGSEETADSDRVSVRRDLEILESLADRVRAIRDASRGPRSAIVDLARETDEKLLVFTRFQRAADGIYRSLVEAFGGRGRVAVATGERGCVTGLGRTSLDEILRRFAPESYAGDPLERHQQIQILVATDCLSEGVNLQDCGQVVLADLPDSALVVEQRIGRFVRPGSPHETVRVYLPRPENWNDTLGLRRRLQRKLSQAEMSGAGFTAAGSMLGGERERTGTTAAVSGAGGDGTERERRRMGPERMGIPAEANEPLAALTKLDALAHRLDARSAEPPSDFWQGEAPVADRCLWVAVEVTRGGRASTRWLLVRDDGSVACRRSALVRPLVALADADLDLAAADPPEPLLASARDWLQNRRSRMEAVSLAPVPLALDSPQHRLWRRFCEWRAAGDLERDESTWTDLRRRLLRPFPRGTTRRLAELLAADAPPARVYRETERILEPIRGRRGQPTFEIVSGVSLWPRPP